MKSTNKARQLPCRVVAPLMIAMSAATVNAANVDELEGRVAELERLLKQQAETAPAKKADGKGLTVYGSLRPALTYNDFGDSSSTDITDFFSRIGLKGEQALGNGLTAFYRGEWDIDVEADGDFGDARLAYAGFKGDFGQVAIGKQWSPHYNIVAEVTDIFNNRSSPFAYDEASPFRTNQMVTYSYSAGGFKLDSGLQFNGDPENSAGGDNSEASEPNHVDSGVIGVGYSFGDVYVGASYLLQQGANDFERSFSSVGASWSVTEDWYVAMTLQEITRDDVAVEYDQSSMDIVTSYALGSGYKFKAGYFDWDGDGQGRSFDGYNLTVERQLSDSVRVFTEWLRRDIEDGDAQDSISVGVRYDFELGLL